MQAWAWLAGLYEGEGSAGVYKSRGRWWESKVRISMTDKDVILRARKLSGVGIVNGPYIKKELRKNGQPRKPHWMWSVSRRKDVVLVLRRMLPYLGARRAKKALEVLSITRKELAQRYPGKSST